MSSRTQKSLKNATTSATIQIFTLLLNFITRTALVLGLGEYYLGINSVMTSLIAVFSLAELGLSNATIYSLYLPLAKEDRLKAEAYIALFKKIYRLIGVLIIAISIAALPLLPSLINTNMSIDVYIIYGLFVCNTAVSYLLFTYRGILIQANQEKYIVSYSDFIFALVSSIGQVVCFVLLNSYVFGLAFLVIGQLAKSGYLFLMSKKRYPLFNYSSKRKLQKEEKLSLLKNVYAMAIGKFSDTANRSAPNIVISAGVGLVESGFFSNYQMVISAISSLMTQLFGSLTASVGNLNVEGSIESKKNTFRRLSFISFFIYSIFVACVWVCINPFVEAWIGEEYLLSAECVFGLTINLLSIGLLHSTVVFKDGCGVFFQGRFRPLVSCILTVVLSIVFVGPFGIAGVIWAPVISRLVTATWYDPWLVYRFVFKESPLTFYKQTFIYACICLVNMLICGAVTSLFGGAPWLLFFEKAIVTILVSILFIGVVFHKHEPMRYCTNMIKQLLRRGKG